MVFDFIVLALNAYKLLLGSNNSMTTTMGSSRLGKLLFADGLMYFIIALVGFHSPYENDLTWQFARFLSNLLATVFMLLNFNAIMSIIFNVPAAVFSTVCLFSSFMAFLSR